VIQLAITSISHRGSQILCSGLALRSNLLLNPLRNTNTFREPLQLPKGKKCKVFDFSNEEGKDNGGGIDEKNENIEKDIGAPKGGYTFQLKEQPHEEGYRSEDESVKN